MNGLLLIKKPIGISSFAVVSAARRALKIKKIGHAGTLDPFADGLLLLAVGGATRALSDFILSEKKYTATVLFGATSETLDPESTIFYEKKPLSITKKKLDTLLKKYFLGEISQIPPSFSAIKVAGERAYRRARRGEAVKIAPRASKVFSAEVLEVFSAEKFRGFPAARFSLRVKSGFYVRSFARDIAEKIGTLGFCSALSRTAIGGFSVADAVAVSEISADKIFPICPDFFQIPAIFLSDAEQKKFFVGQKFPFSFSPDSRVAVFSQKSKKWLGFAVISENILSPKKVVAEKL